MVVRERQYRTVTNVSVLSAEENPGLDEVKAFRRDDGDWEIRYTFLA